MQLLLSLHITCCSSSGRAYGTNLAEAIRMILPTRVYYILGTMPICTVPTENRSGVPQALRKMRAKIGPEKGSLRDGYVVSQIDLDHCAFISTFPRKQEISSHGCTVCFSASWKNIPRIENVTGTRLEAITCTRQRQRASHPWVCTSALRHSKAPGQEQSVF